MESLVVRLPVPWSVLKWVMGLTSNFVDVLHRGDAFSTFGTV